MTAKRVRGRGGMEGGSGHRGRAAFGEFVLDFDRGVLMRGGAEIRLRPQSFRVLCYLVENPGRLVTKGELLDAIWGETVVTEGSLTQCLIDVRRALGDDSRQLIRTAPRRGFIFDAAVVASAPAAVPAASPGDGSAAFPKRRRGGVAALAALLIAATATVWMLPRLDGSDPLTPAAPAGSIAVLPFTDLSEAGNQEYFSDGISEEILNALAKSPDLRVIARTSSFSFKGKVVDIGEIARALNVVYVLEGSVRRSGDRVRISAQLIDASTSTHLWSGTFDREMTDILALQRDIAAAVAHALEVTLGHAGSSAPRDARAYELYLQGRFFHKRRAPGDPERAEAYYRRALAIDPRYGRAWSGLAGTYLVQVVEQQEAALEGRWREAVERALEYAPELPETHVRAAQYFGYAEDDERWREHHRRAMALGPEDPLVLARAAGLDAFFGNIDLAVARQRRAVELDPLSAIDRGNFAHLLAGAGRFEEALAEHRKALDLNPSAAAKLEVNATWILILQDRLHEALERVQRWPAGYDRDAALAMIHGALSGIGAAEPALLRLAARASPAAHSDVFLRLAEVHAFLGLHDEAFRWLTEGRQTVRDRSRTERVGRIHDLRLSPFLIPLRDDPRWAAIVAWDDGPRAFSTRS